MNPSHHRSEEPGAEHHSPPVCHAQSQSTKFAVLRRVPQLLYDPEHAVCAGSEAVALFWNEEAANKYARWRNEGCPKNPTTPT